MASAWDKKKRGSFPKPGMRPSARVINHDPVVKGRENVIFEPNVLANNGNADGTLVAMDGIWVGESTDGTAPQPIPEPPDEPWNQPQPDSDRPAGLRGLRLRT